VHIKPTLVGGWASPRDGKGEPGEAATEIVPGLFSSAGGSKFYGSRTSTIETLRNPKPEDVTKLSVEASEGAFKIRFEGALYAVVWEAEAAPSEMWKDVTIKSVEEGVGGRVVLSNDLAFANPAEPAPDEMDGQEHKGQEVDLLSDSDEEDVSPELLRDVFTPIIPAEMDLSVLEPNPAPSPPPDEISESSDSDREDF
jgi:hypothetical protein